MANLQKMLKGAYVEWKKLGEVCNLQRGKVISKKYLAKHQGIYPVYSSQTRNNGEIGAIDTYDFDGEYATWTTDGEYAGTVFYRNGKFSITNVAGLISCKDKNQLLLKFVFYWLQIETKKYVADGSGNRKLMSNVIANIPIPIPPLKLQQEIVRILDAFTNLCGKLATELVLRKKQYSYYLEKLLCKDNLEKCAMILGEDATLKWATLEEVCMRHKGINITAYKMREIHKAGATVRIFAGGKTIADVEPSDIKQANVIYEPSVIVKSRGNIDFEFYEKPFTHKNELWSYSAIDNNFVNIKFIYYYLKSNLDYFKKNAVNGKLPQIYPKLTDAFSIPIPPIKVQQEVVGVLDKFGALIEDAEGALPAEIAMRKKQYEYYRDALLNFERK